MAAESESLSVVKMVGPPRLHAHMPPGEKDGNPHSDPLFTVLQGPVFRRLGWASAQPHLCHGVYKGLEAIRQDVLKLAQLLVAYDIATMDDYYHLTEHWFDNEHGWWPRQHVERVMTTGLLEAFRAATNTGLPVQCYWVIYDPPARSPQQQVLTRVSVPARRAEGSLQDDGHYAILFQLFTPPGPWTPSPL